MIYNVYTIYDDLGKTSAPPFCAVNDDVAIRETKKFFQDFDSTDFKLYYIGKYDTDIMALINDDPLKLVMEVNVDVKNA